MTVREWFRLARQARQPESEAEGMALLAVRAGDWRGAEFFLLLWRGMLAWPPGRHRWERSADGYWWRCGCGAAVPSEEIDEAGPSADQFDEGCECLACRPCRGRAEAS